MKTSIGIANAFANDGRCERKGRLNSGVALLRRIAVGVVGFAVLLIGIAMLVLPGPAVIVIPLGLAILATEFGWARTLVNKARAKLETLSLNPASTNHPAQR